MVTLGGLIHNNNKFRFSLLLKNTNYSTCFHDRFLLNGNYTLSKHYKQRTKITHSFWFHSVETLKRVRRKTQAQAENYFLINIRKESS